MNFPVFRCYQGKQISPGVDVRSGNPDKQSFVRLSGEDKNQE